MSKIHQSEFNPLLSDTTYELCLWLMNIYKYMIIDTLAAHYPTHCFVDEKLAAKLKGTFTYDKAKSAWDLIQELLSKVEFAVDVSLSNEVAFYDLTNTVQIIVYKVD